VTVLDTESASSILREVSLKLKDKIYENSKMFCLVPIIPKNSDLKPANNFSLAKYGGKSSDFMELMFNN